MQLMLAWNPLFSYLSLPKAGITGLINFTYQAMLKKLKYNTGRGGEASLVFRIDSNGQKWIHVYILNYHIWNHKRLFHGPDMYVQQVIYAV